MRVKSFNAFRPFLYGWIIPIVNNHMTGFTYLFEGGHSTTNMSSPGGSSPVDSPGRHKSQFTYRQLGLLASYSPSSPLRVIAHVDLDAFYAQCGTLALLPYLIA